MKKIQITSGRVIALVGFFFLITYGLSWMLNVISLNEQAMNSEAARLMGDRIGQAKPGAIMVYRDGTPAHIEWSQGKWSHGNVSYNVFGAGHSLTDLKYMGHKIISVIDQNEPGKEELYKEILYAYARGERIDPRRVMRPAR